MDPFKDAEKKIADVIGMVKGRMHEAEKLLAQLPSMAPKEKKTIRVNGVEASLGITLNGTIVLELPDLAAAKEFYAKTNALKSE